MKKFEIHIEVEYPDDVDEQTLAGLEENVRRVVGDGLLELPTQIPDEWELHVGETQTK